MKSYEERFAEASGYYKQGIENVATNPEPKEQKFHIGERVHITKDLPPSMRHFKKDCNATVEYVYAHAYGGNDIGSYSLIIDNYGSSAWYKENQLTRLSEEAL